MRTCAVGLNSGSGRPLAALILVASLVVLGCGFKPAASPTVTGTGGTPGVDGGNGTGGAAGSGAVGGLTSLSISPATATMTVTNTGPAQTQQYMVTGMVSGQTQDLTTKVRYSTNPTGVVTIDTNGLATSTGLKGGVVTVIATFGAQSTTAKLTVTYTFTGADPGPANSSVPTGASSIFTTTTNDMTRSPQLIYPNDGVLFPPNITGIEIHFTPGANNTLFEVSLSGMLTTVNAIVRCTMPTGITTGCIYLMDAGLWAVVANANAGLGSVSLVVRGTDDSGTSVGDSTPIHLQFSKDNIDGALYYWTTSGKSAIMRWDFAGSTQSAQAYLTPTNTDGKTCVGCHALAPDGSKLVASAGGQGDGRLLLWDIKNNVAMQPFALTQRSQFESWNADGTQFVGVYGDMQGSTSGKAGVVNLMLFDGMTGMMTSTIDLGGLRADHPDWSKNTNGANTIVFTSSDPTAKTTDQRPSTGGIDYIQYDGTQWTTPPMQLVPSQLGLNRYYPSISPDGDLVVYDESTCTAGTPAVGAVPDKSCNGDTDATATMFLISLKNGGTPTVLTNANKPGIADGTTTALTNSFPRWSPFISQLDERQQLVWITFSSSRQYGLRPPPPPGTSSSGEAKSGTLIWMVGINPGFSGGDPSYTAFCLPFQDVTTSNHIAQWAKYFLTGPG